VPKRAVSQRRHLQRRYTRRLQLQLQARFHRQLLRVAARSAILRAKSVSQRWRLLGADRQRIPMQMPTGMDRKELRNEYQRVRLKPVQ
jgi:hypothetical protein